MNIFENALEPLRRSRRRARNRKNALPGSFSWRSTGTGEQFNHSPLSYAGDPTGYSGDIGLLLVHGFTGSPHSLHPVARYFKDLGYPVELPLLPGHGTHWRNMAASSYTDWLAEVEAAYWRLVRSNRRVVIAGMSMGGTLAAHISARLPTAGTVLINPFFVDVNPLMRFAHRVAVLAPVMKSIGSDIAVPGVREGAYPLTPTVSIYQLHLLGAEVRPLLPALRAPVLYMRSTGDHTVTDASHRYFLENCSAPVEFRWLTRSYHVATLDYDAEQVLKLTHYFMQSLEGRGRTTQ